MTRDIVDINDFTILVETGSFERNYINVMKRSPKQSDLS